MNTQKSEAFVKGWMAKGNPLRRISFTAQRKFQTSPEEIFPLLCPATELDWLPGWNCELLHSKSGYAELNCIFRTTFFGLDEIFICTRYEKNLAVDYLRVSEHMSGKLDIKLLDHHDGTTTGVWLITLSSLDEAGSELFENVLDARELFEKAIDALEYYLKNGEMIGHERQH